MKRLLAIDPGMSGGCAWIDVDGIVQAVKMPATLVDISELLQELKASGITDVIMEKTGTYRHGQSGPASVKFARHCGNLEGLLVGLGFALEEVPPNTWMKKLGTMPKEKKDRKNHIKSIVQMKYPHIKVTLATSDALGIMYAYTKEV